MSNGMDEYQKHSGILRLEREAERTAHLRARVAELEAERAWQPIATAPKDDRCVMWVPTYSSDAGTIYAHATIGRPRNYSYATHWMPLPAPPKDIPNER